MSKKVTIIGAGNVGATIAFTLAVNGIANEIVLIDINQTKAFGEAMDIRQGTAYTPDCTIINGDYPDAAGSDIVVLTSGMARKPGQTRLELAQVNVNITKSIIPEITKAAPDAYYVIVANPVDVLTYVFHKCSNIPEHKIIGSGTILDTARLRQRLAELYKVNPHHVHANIYGEHGDSSFVPWSLANIGGFPIDQYAECAGMDPVPEALDHDAIEDFVRKSGGVVIKSKGATFHAVAISVCNICKCLFGAQNSVLAVSTLMHGEYGIDDVCLSTLALVGPNGMAGKINAPLTDEEVAKLQHSAECLKAVINGIEI